MASFCPSTAERTSVRGAIQGQLLAIAGGEGTIVRHDSRSWASSTFEGARHTLTIAFEGATAVEGGEDLVEQLAEHEFVIPGQLVVGALVKEVEQQLAPDPRLIVVAELLVLKDC